MNVEAIGTGFLQPHLLQAPRYAYISFKRPTMHSNLTQWKRAGLITLKSLDRNQELLTFELFWI